MNKDNVSIQVQLLNILLSCFQKELKVFGANSLLSPMKSIVEFLGYLEKLGIPLDDIPAGIHAELPEQRHHATQNLGDTTPGEGGVDILNDLTREPAAKQSQLLDSAPANDRLVARDAYLTRFSISCISDDLSPSSV